MSLLQRNHAATQMLARCVTTRAGCLSWIQNALLVSPLCNTLRPLSKAWQLKEARATMYVQMCGPGNAQLAISCSLCLSVKLICCQVDILITIHILGGSLPCPSDSISIYVQA